MKSKEEILKSEKDAFSYNWGRSSDDMANYAPNEVCHKAMQTFADQENAELKFDLNTHKVLYDTSVTMIMELRKNIKTKDTEIDNLRRRLSDCERKRITGERI